MNRFKELKVWQKSIEMTTNLYSITANFPDKEKFALVSQMNRAAVSIPSNIAEGAGRNSKKEFNNFLGIAIGSSFELETQLIIAEKLNYVHKTELESVQKLLLEVQNMLVALQKAIKEVSHEARLK